VERLAYWLCSGLVSLGTPGASAAVETTVVGDADGAPHLPPAPGVSRGSRIRYPLQVHDWQAVGEHLFEEREYGMSVRYAHGRDRDRWIDVYFYPAGALSTAEFAAAAQDEADMIGEAHALAGYEDCDMSPLRDFSFPARRGSGRTIVEGLALDLAYAVDDIVYSSAMTLSREGVYFVKARFSVERRILSRDDAREQLLAFTAQLQPRLSIVDCHPTARAGTSPRGYEPALAGLREIRLDYQADSRIPASRPVPEDAEAG
jgi:hypothetical protein